MAGRLDDASLAVDTKVRGASPRDQRALLADRVAQRQRFPRSAPKTRCTCRTSGLKPYEEAGDLRRHPDDRRQERLRHGVVRPRLAARHGQRVLRGRHHSKSRPPASRASPRRRRNDVDVDSEGRGASRRAWSHTHAWHAASNYNTQLDALAYDSGASKVHTLCDAGFTLGGVDAPLFFNALGSATGASSLIGA